MKNVRILCASALALVLLSGCATAINQKMASWIGHNESELIMSWGPPAQVFSDGSGGRILIYTAVRSFTSPGTATTNTHGTATGGLYGNQAYLSGQSQSYTTFTPATTSQWTAYRMFRVDTVGTITGYSWRGL
ncbi:MAG: hypothetical protein OEW11_10755 [Nitrospirota bacterium]|nr:hypothetical protein [Nitrospirota bacterium]